MTSRGIRRIMVFRSLPEDLERSLRRGRHRARAFDKVVARRRMTVRQLADELGLPQDRVMGILVGDPTDKRRYAVHLSLVVLGVVRLIWSGWACEVEATPLGLHHASLRGK